MEQQETPVEAQPHELVNDLVAKPSTPKFFADNYLAIRASILAGMGLEAMDNALADRMEDAIRRGLIECWILYEPDDLSPKFCGSITFFIATDALLAEKYMYIYSLHCSKKVALEAWRQPFKSIFAHAEAAGCKHIWGRTKLDHVVEIAKDNDFVISAHLERTV